MKSRERDENRARINNIVFPEHEAFSCVSPFSFTSFFPSTTIETD